MLGGALHMAAVLLLETLQQGNVGFSQSHWPSDQPR
jgi:hypothetical protein